MDETPNRTWWIVLTPTPMRELNGVLVDDQGRRVHVQMGPVEEALVHELAQHAERGVDLSIAPEGWSQVPDDIREAYEANRSTRR